MNTFAEKLYRELTEDLALIHDLGDAPVRRLTTALQTIKAAREKLTAYQAIHPFESDAEQIDFNKRWKPRMEAERFYALEKFTIETNRPLADPQLIKIYYEQELAFTRRYFTQHAFLYQYQQLGFTELDQLLFIKGELPGLDEPATVFARLIAYEKLQHYLLGQLNIKTEKNGPTLRWTGEAINLVEIAYGIWLTAQLNDGNATITDIVLWLEEKLSVKIGTPNARWTQIAARKNIPPTKYTDQIREALLKRIDNELTNQNQKRKARRMN